MPPMAPPHTPTQFNSNSDNNLAGHVVMALRNTGYPEIYKLDVIVDAQEVRLYGRVSSYYFRQRAETAALGIPGVTAVKSNIVIAAK